MPTATSTAENVLVGGAKPFPFIYSPRAPWHMGRESQRHDKTGRKPKEWISEHHSAASRSRWPAPPLLQHSVAAAGINRWKAFRQPSVETCPKTQDKEDQQRHGMRKYKFTAMDNVGEWRATAIEKYCLDLATTLSLNLYFDQYNTQFVAWRLTSKRAVSLCLEMPSTTLQDRDEESNKYRQTFGLHIWTPLLHLQPWTSGRWNYINCCCFVAP